MLSAGLGPLSYRLRTELGSEAWHFNPIGAWSDAARHQGYWTSSARPAHGAAPATSYGYRLPRRGNTIDQANNDGYSRLDDGDSRTFWKSNPYLDSHFTGEPDTSHPQWAQVDLGAERPVDAITLRWADPYASRLQVQYWSGSMPPNRNGAENENRLFAGPPTGDWHDFPGGRLAGRGGDQRLRLAPLPRTVRYVRVLMSASSHTAPSGSRDVRERLGYALREVSVGRLDSVGRLHDWVRHGASNSTQSIVWVSSTDPWHRARDLDPNTEQPSFERVASSGLTRGQPLLVAVPIAYGTPADAAAELRYLHARGIAVTRAELGEEPDGQLLGPEDYGALYDQFARVLARAAPRVTLGGPGLATSVPDWTVTPDASGNRSWTSRFLAELRRRGALHKLGFFSFEWYPFDDICSPAAPQLLDAPRMLADLLARQRRAGLPDGVPKLITEYGYSPFAAQAEVALSGGLLDADIAARFLALGGQTSYLYGYEPDALIRESQRCASYGNLGLLQSDDSHHILHPLASYYAMRLLTREWLAPTPGGHRLLAISGGPHDHAGRELVSGYPVQRPDGRLSILLINRDPSHAHRIRIELDPGGAPRGGLDLYTLSPAQYAWHPNASHGYPRPDLPPAHAHPRTDSWLTLPATSLTVVRTRSPLRAHRVGGGV